MYWWKSYEKLSKEELKRRLEPYITCSEKTKVIEAKVYRGFCKDVEKFIKNVFNVNVKVVVYYKKYFNDDDITDYYYGECDIVKNTIYIWFVVDIEEDLLEDISIGHIIIHEMYHYLRYKIDNFVPATPIENETEERRANRFVLKNEVYAYDILDIRGRHDEIDRWIFDLETRGILNRYLRKYGRNSEVW